MECKNKTVEKQSDTIESGFKCHHCHLQTITYDINTVPKKCWNCGHHELGLIWRNRIVCHTVVEILPL